tara:strand:- start:519 stop:1274 length:756 start_codon:yes stop_codon:yes gene_type:complete
VNERNSGELANMNPYRKAPIVEAVLDFSFVSTLSAREMERLRDKLKKRFPAIKDRLNIEVEVRDARAAARATPHGFQMNAANGSDAVIVRPDGFSNIRLAPYVSWAEFEKKSRENYKILTELLGHLSVKRIGLRYINRIDVPDEEIIGKELNVLFSCFIPQMANCIQDLFTFESSGRISEDATKHAVNYRIASTTPALIDHQSFMLDIDAFCESLDLGKSEKLWSTVNELRTAKNNIFESTITEKVRALFK